MFGKAKTMKKSGRKTGKNASKKKKKESEDELEKFESDDTEDYTDELKSSDDILEENDGVEDLRKLGYREMLNMKIVKVEKDQDGYEIQKNGRLPSNLHTCLDCGKQFSKQRLLKAHRETLCHEASQSTTCDECGRIFNTTSALKIHLVKLHGKDIKMPTNSDQLQAMLLTCEFCGKEFKKANDLFVHRKVHVREKIYCCSICNKEYSRKSKLEKHMKSAHKPKKKLEKEKQMEDKEDKHEIQTYQCEICYEKYTCKCKYEEHFLTHKEEKGYKCPKCDEHAEYFTSVEDLKLHIASANHTIQAADDETEDNTAGICCEFCGKTFKKLSTHRIHVRGHTGERIFECKTCGDAFLRKYQLEKHMKKHVDGEEESLSDVTKKGRYKCPNCNKTYPTDTSLKRHLARHEGMKFKCNDCGKMFMRNESLQMHIIREGHSTGKDLSQFAKKLISCKVCNKQFLRPSLLLKHMKSHSGKADPLFCLKCFEMFETEEDQKVHKCNIQDKPKKSKVSKESGDEDSKPLPEEVSKILQEKIDDTESRVDGSIEETFRNMSVDELEGLLQMMGETADTLPPQDVKEKGEMEHNDSTEVKTKQHEPSADTIAAQRMRAFFINKALRMKSEKGKFKIDGKSYFKCSYCPKYFARRGVTQNHERRHTGSKPFKCETCGRGFSMVATLKNHVLVHAEVKPYKCDICDKGFVQKASLVRHKFMHTGEAPPHKCDTCNKAFYRESELRKHKEKHDETIPKVFHMCEQCGKSFVTKQGLKNHGMLHEPIKKYYTCHICDRKFTMAIRLKKHLLVHSDDRPYICNYCGKGFARSHYLTNHIRVHTGEKRFKCSYCFKGFTTSGQLSIHTRSHTGEKPYACSICGKRSTDSANHIKHMRTHQDKNVARNPANEKHRPSTYVSRVNANTNQTENHNHNANVVLPNTTVMEETTLTYTNTTTHMPLSQPIDRQMGVLQAENYVNLKHMRPIDNESMLQTLHNPLQLTHNATMPPDAHAQSRITRPSNFFNPMPPAHFSMPNPGYTENPSQFMFRYNDRL